MNQKKRSPKIRKELSVFDEELNLQFNPSEFLPDLPSHAKEDLSLTAPKRETIGGQSGDEWRTNGRQSEDKRETDFHEMEDKRGTKWGTTGRTNGRQSEDKRETNSPFSSLVGLQRKIILLVYSSSKFSRSRISEPLTLEHIAKILEIRDGSVKKSIQRLKQKGVLKTAEIKIGRAGWAKYEMPDPVFQEILHQETEDKRETIGGQTGDKRGTKWGTKRETSSLSSSSYLDLNKTTTTENAEFEKTSDFISDPVWSQIDLDPLKEIGFNTLHVAQVQKQGLHSPKTLQDSIYAFKFDLNANGRGSKISGEPLNFFMGILRKGPYAPPQNYESPEDRQLREYLEAKEKLLEKRRENLNRVKELEFEEWLDPLSKSEKETLAPMGTNEHLKRSQLRNHFDEHIWEEKKKEIIIGFAGERSSELLLSIEKSEYDSTSTPPLNPP
jgi:hypothetical protein